jgi:hypothetical protein
VSAAPIVEGSDASATIERKSLTLRITQTNAQQRRSKRNNVLNGPAAAGQPSETNTLQPELGDDEKGIKNGHDINNRSCVAVHQQVSFHQFKERVY